MESQLQVLRWIQEIRNPILDAFFTLVTMSAEEVFFIVVAAWLLWCAGKEVGYRVGFAFLSSTVVNPLLKNAFRVERPIGSEGVESMRVHTATGYAFPSGHTQGAASFWTSLMSSVPRRPVLVAGTAMVLLVAFSRMYLGVHWPADVLGGMVIGVVWVLLVNRLYDRARESDKPQLLLILIAPLAAGYFLAPDKAYLVSMGSLLGFWAGFVIEQRYIRYDVSARLPVQLLKLALGLAVLLLIKEGLKPLLFFVGHADVLIRYTFIGFWLTAGAPCLFSRVFTRLK